MIVKHLSLPGISYKQMLIKNNGKICILFGV